MAKYLVIVESPTKEKTISKILGPDYAVKSSYGHIRDLPKSQLGIDVDNGFTPKYLNIAKAKKILPELKKLSAKATTVYLATDYDREGEAIAWHLKEAIGLPAAKFKRITFHEITPEAIKGSLTHPRSIDMDLVDAQQARRVLDRLVGYKLSPLLWKKVKSGTSAGRVQSVAVRMICDREEEIEKFKPQEYWSLAAKLAKRDEKAAEFTAMLVAHEGKKYDKLDLNNKILMDGIVGELSKASYTVSSIERKERRRQPYAPYTTSTIQQDASRRIYFSAAKTMKIAQQLYEGISLGSEGSVGLITYMRTDSVSIAEPARKEARQYIEKTFGKTFVPEKARMYKTKTKGAQEAHEAIRPTSAVRAPRDVKQYLSADEYKLYELIWCRFLASQMTDAVYDTVSADITAKTYVFRASGSTLKFDGFLKVYDMVKAEEADDEEEKTAVLPPLSEKELLNLIELLPAQHFTEPPPRFNEASLIKTLEEHGIGRPSTYAPIINTIVQRNYVRLESRRFFPTSLGKVVNDVMKTHFAQIVDVAFTAALEEKLDRVAEGKSPWAKVIEEFYGPLKKDIAAAEVNLVRQKIEPQKTDEVCPKCGKPMVLRDSWRGQFLACSGYPECKTTFSVDKEGKKIVKPPPEVTSFTCEKCGKAMLKRISKRGPFLACSGFPKCRNIKPWREDGQDAAAVVPPPEK
ncbi:MAG: type I DNA topoisomerase [Elusimicrobia bacterium]|nr:type I DNA topoisomerase [Elusimicrobiota bacterium]